MFNKTKLSFLLALGMVLPFSNLSFADFSPKEVSVVKGDTDYLNSIAMYENLVDSKYEVKYLNSLDDINKTGRFKIEAGVSNVNDPNNKETVDITVNVVDKNEMGNEFEGKTFTFDMKPYEVLNSNLVKNKVMEIPSTYEVFIPKDAKDLAKGGNVDLDVTTKIFNEKGFYNNIHLKIKVDSEREDATVSNQKTTKETTKENIKVKKEPKENKKVGSNAVSVSKKDNKLVAIIDGRGVYYNTEFGSKKFIDIASMNYKAQQDFIKTLSSKDASTLQEALKEYDRSLALNSGDKINDKSSADMENKNNRSDLLGLGENNKEDSDSSSSSQDAETQEDKPKTGVKTSLIIGTIAIGAACLGLGAFYYKKNKK